MPGLDATEIGLGDIGADPDRRREAQDIDGFARLNDGPRLAHAAQDGAIARRDQIGVGQLPLGRLQVGLPLVELRLGECDVLRAEADLLKPQRLARGVE